MDYEQEIIITSWNHCSNRIYHLWTVRHQGRVQYFRRFVSYSSYSIKKRGYVESWRIRKEVFTDCVSKLEETSLGNKPHLIANVPFFTQRNYNNEHVFWLNWDFDKGLNLFGSEKLSSAFPFCWQTLINPDYYPHHNINHHLGELPEDANLWYYEYDLDSSISALLKVDDRSHLEEEFQRIVKNKVNYHPIILRQRIRMKLKEWVMRRIHFDLLTLH